jgi:uncharacterized protein (DUF934 family)
MQFIDSQAALPEGALLLDNHADVLALVDEISRHAVVVLQFPKWTDGRAYSQAVLLRARLRYTGEIRATGEVLADMLPLLRRCGFDAVQMRADQQLETAQRALGYFDNHYQTVPPERTPALSNTHSLHRTREAAP